MASWHQNKIPVNWTKTSGYVLVSDGTNSMATAMTFDSEHTAMKSLAVHREKQPDKFHFLYHNGKIIA